MATRSRIGIENPDGTVDSIYCHFDGQPSHNGIMLYFHYQTRDKVKELMELGDISYLESNLTPTGDHSFTQPEAGVTLAYHRDRGEDYWPPLKQSNADSYFKPKATGEDYKYLYTKSGEWLISGYSSNGPSKLEDILISMKINGVGS